MKHKFILPMIASLFLLNLACTPTARWGDRAFYSPAHRGYVISQEVTDNRPDQYAAAIILVDPIEGKKVTCQDQAERVLDAHARIKADDVKRDNATVVTSLVFLPMTAVAGVGGFLFMSGGAYSVGIAEMAIPGATEHYHEGLEFFKKEKWRSARKKLELAVTGSEAISRGTKALFQLGRVYEELGEDELAERSYTAFLQRSAANAEAEYMRAESYLKEHDIPLDRCPAQGDIEVVWPD